VSEVYYDAAGVEDLVQEVLDYGVWCKNERTGEMVRSIFDAKIVIEEGDFPFFTNVQASPRLAFEEFWFFINGKTNTKELEAKGVNFWKSNTCETFQESVGLGYLEEGDLGAAYSQQWRNSGGYDEAWAYLYGNGGEGQTGGVDQLKQLLVGLLNDKYSRRHLVTLWNPKENPLGVLTPCHWASQYVVLPDRQGNDVLHLKLINRSVDIVFGLRFALMQYRMFQMALCKMYGFKLGKLSCDMSHVHIYENQVEYAKELLKCEYVATTLSDITLTKDIACMEDLLSLQWSDWDMVYETNRAPFKTQRPEMVA
jgi:thymidylate synthase